MSKEQIWNSIKNAPTFKDAWDRKPEESILQESTRPPPVICLKVFKSFWSNVATEIGMSCSAPVDYIIGAILVFAAALIGNARRASWKSWSEPTILWLFLVGAVSSGKTPAVSTIFNYIVKMQNWLNKAYKQAREKWVKDCNQIIKQQCGDKAELKQAGYSYKKLKQMDFGVEFPPEPKKRRLYVIDSTTQAVAPILANNPKGIVLYRDEISGFIKDFNRFSKKGGDREFWTESFNGKPYAVDRKTDEEDLMLPYLTISIIGGIQPKKLALLTSDDEEDGFYERVLFMWPNLAELTDPIDITDDPKISQAFEILQNLEMALDDNKDPIPQKTPLSIQATEQIRKFRHQMREKTLKSSGPIATYYGKMPGIAMRLSLVLEYLWAVGEHIEKEKTHTFVEPNEVSEQAILGACALIDSYFLPMAQRALNDAFLPDDQRNAAIIARYIKENPPNPPLLNARELRNSKNRPEGLTKDSKQIEAALERLCDDGWLKPAPSRQSDHGGRQRKDYLIHPNYWSKAKK